MALTSAEIKEHCRELGFDKVGIVAAQSLSAESERLHEWLALGFHGKMGYMERAPERRGDPRLLLPSARSVIAVAMNYYTPHKHVDDPAVGKISRYAWGDDYHDLIGARLQSLIDWIKARAPEAEAKSYVDAGPMMDKAWAVRAGIGWLGKHTNVITRDYGSWIFLGEVIVNLQLEYDDNVVPDYCGKCTRCIDACPTGAIVEPYLVDGRRCISYGTIELKDAQLPGEIGANLKNWIFGCDICQDVCPWNRFAKESAEAGYQPREGLTEPQLDQMSELSIDEFKQRFAGSPIKRSKHAGLMRNIKAAQSANDADEVNDEDEDYD